MIAKSAAVAPAGIPASILLERQADIRALNLRGRPLKEKVKTLLKQ
ncbi:MAG TPA: hypothetical protein VLU25_04325 [Acidobacteriota bacterium]|nr:hypothetical protein [Acidobacteriota bacterium]